MSRMRRTILSAAASLTWLAIMPAIVEAAELGEPTAFAQASPDADAIAEGLGRLLEDDALRADLAERGPYRTAQFSWERCARETLAVYKAVVG